MLTRFRKAMDKREEGFTLIELLVVMIIIGILAAIAIPVFLSQQNKAKDTSAKSDVTVIGKDIQAYYVDGTSGLTVSTGTGTDAGKFLIKETGAAATVAPIDSGKLSTGNTIKTTRVNSAADYCVSVINGARADSTWKYTQDGLVKGDC